MIPITELTYIIRGLCINVHRKLGAGLLEKVYQTVLAYEISKAGFSVKTEVQIPIKYDNIEIDAGFRADIIVENRLIIELKAVDQILPVHFAQLRTYMKLSGINHGVLVNFNCVHIFHEGIFTLAI